MKAWELLEDPKKWTTGAYARTASGELRQSHDADATCWCTIGAIRRCYNLHEWAPKVLQLSQHVGQVPVWNDSSDHTTVIAKLKELDI